MNEKQEQLLRGYAANEVTWSTLRHSGFETYVDVLAGLDELHLKPPIAPLIGPSAEARLRGRDVMRKIFQQRAL